MLLEQATVDVSAQTATRLMTAVPISVVRQVLICLTNISSHQKMVFK
jgi:hypothetical protein